jgi:hypothetical protein
MLVFWILFLFLNKTAVISFSIQDTSCCIALLSDLIRVLFACKFCVLWLSVCVMNHFYHFKFVLVVLAVLPITVSSMGGSNVFGIVRNRLELMRFVQEKAFIMLDALEQDEEGALAQPNKRSWSSILGSVGYEKS